MCVHVVCVPVYVKYLGQHGIPLPICFIQVTHIISFGMNLLLYLKISFSMTCKCVYTAVTNDVILLISAHCCHGAIDVMYTCVWCHGDCHGYSPDGMELPMEKSSEYEAHDIKVCGHLAVFLTVT